jgi:sugar lactone lactonase YvrE
MSGTLDVAFDSHLNLWVVDDGNRRVLQFKPPFKDGMDASLVIGQPDLTTSTPMISQSRLFNPIGIRFDSSENLWVVDSAACRVLGYKPPFTNGKNADLVIGQGTNPPTCFTTSTAATTQNGLNSPSHVAFDSLGNLWVSDSGNNRVLMYPYNAATNPPFGFSNGMPATLVIGQGQVNDPPSWNTLTPATSQNGLNNPTGIAFDRDGSLWVADTTNSRVIEFIPPAPHAFLNGMWASCVMGQTGFFPPNQNPATSQNGLNFPVDIAFDVHGNLWVADTQNSRVLRYPPPFSDGMPADLVLGQGANPSTCFTTTAPATGKSGLAFPNAVALIVDAETPPPFEENLWVSDGGRVLEFRPARSLRNI